MSDVTFVFSNPRHHLDMMARPARLLRARGFDCRFVSFAELRGFVSPRDLDFPLRRVIPYNLRGSPSVGATVGDRRPGARALVRNLLSAALTPVARALIGRTRVLVIPNDAAFPYDRLTAAMPRTPVVLLQEGIRFEMPNGDAYGTRGATKICAWGQGSADFFRARGAQSSQIEITGSPRHDDLQPAAFRDRGRALRERLGLREAPIALVTNPIETQGFSTRGEKEAMVRAFLAEAAPVLRARGVSVVVKNHAFEDPAAYAAVAASGPAADLVHVDPSSSLFEAFAASRAAIVMTSTAGIEALLFGLPLGALELPRGGFGFEYVQRGAAVGLQGGSVAAAMASLLDDAASRTRAAEDLVSRHLHARGQAAANVADVIAGVARR